MYIAGLQKDQREHIVRKMSNKFLPQPKFCQNHFFMSPNPNKYVPHFHYNSIINLKSLQSHDRVLIPIHFRRD